LHDAAPDPPRHAHRNMRLPGSFNAKRGRWCRVLRADRSRVLVDPDRVRRALHVRRLVQVPR
jgi:hypothetical protein